MAEAAQTGAGAGAEAPAPDRDGIYALMVGETGGGAALAFILSVAAGILQALVIFLIASDAERLAHHELDSGNLLIFLIAVTCFGALLVVSIRQNVRVIDLTIFAVGARLAGYVRRAELPDLERIGTEAIHGAITRDIITIGGMAPLALSALQTGGLVGTCYLLILWKSPTVAGLGALVLLGMLPLHRAYQRRLRDSARAAHRAEDRFCTLLDGALAGLKELKLNQTKSRDYYFTEVLPATDDAAESRVFAGSSFVVQLQLTLGTWFLFVIAACFVAPSLDVASGIATSAVMLAFLRTPMVDFASYLPAIVNARVAIERLHQIERQLAAVAQRRPRWQSPEPGFESLRLRGITHRYTDAEGNPVFNLGPIDFDVEAGEIVLIVGGNGSGKSTLLKILTGLYPPLSGTLLVDERPPLPDELRGLFSAVFTDFHLFSRLYGLGEIDAAATDRLLEVLDLAHKLSIKDGVFSTLELSTGQRRRLALIAAYLERRPIVVFDEWTADQDPEFRRFFYEELLPELKRRGRTVIAITHDDSRLRVADRLYRLRDGRVADVHLSPAAAMPPATRV